MDASSPAQSPQTPSSSRHTFGADTSPALHQYSDALRRAMGARFQAVAQAGSKAQLPEDARHDPEYGYDENPFDTRARLMQSFAAKLESGSGTHSGSSESSGATAEGPPTPQHPPLDSMGALEVSLDSPTGSYFDLGGLDPALDAGPFERSYSGASYASFGCDTPSSEASFEAGRASDYLSLYGASPASSVGSRRPLTPRTPLTPLTPGRRRRYHPYGDEGGEWSEAVLTRTTSETMLLAAGLGAQRHRRRRPEPASASTSTGPAPPLAAA